MPEKSGMDAALCAPLPVGPTAGVTACPKAAVTEAAAAANVANKRKSRRRTPMATSLSWFRRHLSGNATALRLRPKGTRGVCIWPTSADLRGAQSRQLSEVLGTCRRADSSTSTGLLLTIAAKPPPFRLGVDAVEKVRGILLNATIGSSESAF
jgi:hypothetical protein